MQVYTENNVNLTKDQFQVVHFEMNSGKTTENKNQVLQKRLLNKSNINIKET